MPQYPIGTIKENLYTKGGEFSLRGTEYVGYYHQIYNKVYTDKFPTNTSRELERLNTSSIQQNNPSHNSSKLYLSMRFNYGGFKTINQIEFNRLKNNPLYTTLEIDLNNTLEKNKYITQYPEIKNIIDAL